MSDTYRNDPALTPITANYPGIILDGMGNSARDDLDRILEIARLLLSVLTQDELDQIEASFNSPPRAIK